MAILMATKQDDARSWLWRNAWVWAWLLAVACVNFVPRNGWDKNAGPVIPHDSFPADCSLCHEGSDWQTLRADFTYDHLAQTGVALEGAHQQASCLRCHNDRGPVQQFAARGCGGCHNDPHLTRLGANCADCHEQRSWYPRQAIADHDRTRFPLIGAHAAVACFRCHAGAEVGNFAGAPADCRDCHQAEYANTQTPNHAQVAFSTQCRECHLPTGWQPARFDHTPSFPLSFGHAGLACAACHAEANVFTGLTSDCATCHTDEFATTTEPSHNAAGFALQCENCHDTRTFTRASWQHPGNFALTFGHAGRRCSECHVGQTYSGTQEDCASCHLDSYQATSSPNHTTAGFGTDCQTCHSTATWAGAIGHPATFPLENGHQRACTDCHIGNVFPGLSTACASCHLALYNATTDPPHASFGLSQLCEQCHGTSSWGSGNWQHQFPINSGRHSGFDCFDCHNNPANRQQFSCIDCHEHRASNTNGEHNGVSGYTYTTAGCYSCHPTGHE